MPGEDRPTRSLERCDRHPGSAAIARCEGCGRPLCLTCAIPVRGAAYGAECLGAVLGSDTPVAPETGVRTPDALARTIGRIAFGLAVLSTVLPWSRFGPGSDAFGAWSRSSRWSLVAAFAATAGLALSLLQRHPRLRTPSLDAATAGLSSVVVAASVLAVLFPAAFSRPWLGPWAAVAFGALACGSSILAGRSAERPTAVTI